MQATYNLDMKPTQSETFLTQLGNAIRDKRLVCQLSQEQLADKANLHRTYIGMVERAERNITIINLLKICEALEISLSDLLSFQGNMSHDSDQ
ncbi:MULTISPECIES: helix-turn-helix domain-containing protein [unclassified Moraxella]|uniref:helix-turn-helix domain-containing protein n=1 Tax=unclassified Moraxella TaxID=2685852 RepID=UPI003AF72820